MMRYSNICVVILQVILGTATASVPSVDQLLDRFAANADSHSGSFKIKLESSREVIIRKIDSTFFKPGKSQEHHSLDCRWDGQRMRLRRRSRFGPGITKISSGEWGFYESTLYDLSERVFYRKPDDQPEKQTVSYYDNGLPREACFHEVIISVANWVWGYFLGDEGDTRIDGFIRWSPTARVRPKTELVGNSECYVLEADTRNAKYTIWFDPTHGYNYARLHYEKPGTKIVVSNRLFRKYEKAWIPMEMEWEVQEIRLPESDMSYSQKTVVTEFEVNPDHEKLQSFVMDDIPEGTKAVFVSGKGHQMPGKFEWHNGKPVPCLEEKTLARLNSAAESIIGHAASVSSTDTNKYSLDVTSAGGASPAPHCGLHCLYLVMKAYGQDPNFGELVTPEYLDTPDGSTLSGLKTAVQDAGLHAEIVLRANTRVLRSCPGPVILHVSGKTSRDYDHYILFLGTEGSWARICDPPGSVRLVSFDELSSRWDGKGLVVANKPIQMAGLVRQAKMRLFFMAGLVILTMLVIGRVQRHIVWPEILSSVTGRSAMSVVQFGGLAVVSLVIGLVFHSVCKGGFLRYPDGVASTQRAHVTDFIPRIELSTAKRLIKEGSIFVDARVKRDFDSEHVDGAINVPVDANDVIRRDAMKAVPLGVPVVVYCQSEMCQFADIIAGKIRMEGFSDVSILPGGWMEWKTGISPRKHKPNKNSKSIKWRLNSDGTASPK